MNSKIRVLYITDSLKQRFGITAVITNYLKHFDWQVMKVDVLAFDDSEPEVMDLYKSLGADIYFMPRLGLTNYMSFRKFMQGFFAEHQYEIVHSHFYQIDSIVFPIAKKSGVKTCISHSHATKFSDYKLRAIRNRLMSLNIGKVADVWAACSDEAGETLFGLSYRNSAKRLIVKNGIESKNYRFSQDVRDRVRKDLGIADDEFVIGHVGSQKPPKNHVYLIDVFSELSKMKEGNKLVLVGDGPLMGDMKAKVHDLGLDSKVLFLGTRSDVADLFNAFDLFVLPSLFEGLGIVAVEAQANGLECLLSTNVPKEADITGVTYLDIKEAPSVWAEEILKRGKRRHEDFNGKVVAAGYDINTAASELQSFYGKILSM